MLTVNILTHLRCEAKKRKEKIVAHLRLRFSLHFESTAFTVVTAPSHTVTHLAAVHFICEWGSILGKAFRTLTLTECTHPFHFMQTCRFFLGENIISLSTSLDTRNVLSSQMLFIQSCYKFNRILLFSTLSPHHFLVSTCLYAAQQLTCFIHPHGETLLCHEY